MQDKKFNVLLDLQWGSCGKGKFAPYLADQFAIRHVSCSHRPNAGHTVRIGALSWVLKCLPSAVVLRTAFGRPMSCYLSAGASFEAKTLAAETQVHAPHFYSIHPRAMLVTPAHKEAEAGLSVIASTMQGAGAALIDKISRRVEGMDSTVDGWLDYIHALVNDHPILHEAAQGWELSIDHGYKYPHVTSRNCGTAAALDEMGISPRTLGDVYGVFRPFPIRVGNLGEHSSGSTPGIELTWEKILRAAGAPSDILEEHIQKYEYTTVTKRRRRVFEFSASALQRAVRSNSVTHLVLNFVQYLDWSLAGVCGRYKLRELPRNVRDFIHQVQNSTGVPVTQLGTGPEHTEVIELC